MCFERLLTSPHERINCVLGLADSLRNELLLYNIGVSIYCPANIDTEGFKEEQKIKPAETKEIEGAATLLTPDYAADCLLNGLKKGHYVILSEFFPSDFMRAVVHPVFIPRNSVLFDAIIAPVFAVVGGFILVWADGVVRAAGKKLPATKKQN
jgi:3-dehydrosphinganine reductase